MFGAIFSAGWTIDDVLDLTFDQIAFVGESMATYRSESINMIAEPVLAALGSKTAGRRASKRASKQSREKMTPEQRDAALVATLRSSGFPVR